VRFEYPETADTFLGNSYGKALALWNQVRDSAYSNAVVIADDSGICVDALNGAPGVYSARYGAETHGAGLTDTDRNRILLEALTGVRDRQAHYVCCMVLVLSEDRFFVAQETWHGQIALEPSSGSGGFGYDPVFLLPERGVTVADISAEEKNSLSHRGKALRRIQAVARSLTTETAR
jgi:XTP/dITP diphosphohydrolase